MQHRFEKSHAWRQFMAILYIVMMVSYLTWRITIINSDSLGLSLTFLVADCTGFVLGIAVVLSSHKHSYSFAGIPHKKYSLDILIPVYKEPIHIIRQTLKAAAALNYPHNTYVLDDGKRDEVKILAESFGIIYLSRDDNLHAKAGNLNFGLSYCQAELVLVLDADHIVMPDGLHDLLGYFNDPNVSMVQTPQDYYNTTAFPFMNDRRRGVVWFDHSFFYNMVQPCGHAVNAATCVGTGVIYRRECLDIAGGFPTETITEDFHLSIKLHKLGYKAVYVNNPIAYGVDAADLEEYQVTRHRWTHGNLHAATIENIIFSNSLTLRQKIHYLCLLSPFLEGWQQMLLFCVPIIALTTGYQPFEITVLNVLIVTFFPILSYRLLTEVSCGFSRFWASELFSMARWPFYIKSTMALFGYRMTWKSSKKNMKGKVAWRNLYPQIILCGLSVLAVIVGIIHLDGHYSAGPIFQFIWSVITFQALPDFDLNARLDDGYTIDLVAVAGAWAIYNSVRVLALIVKANTNAKNSHEFFRFAISLPVKMETDNFYSGCTDYISENWISFNLDRHQLVGHSHAKMTIVLPSGPLELTLYIQSISGSHVEADIIWSDKEERDRLSAPLYSVNWHREVSASSYTKMKYSPFLYGQNTHYGAVSYDAKTMKGTLICFEPLKARTELSGQIFDSDMDKKNIQIIGPHPHSAAPSCGLNGLKCFKYAISFK